MRKTTSLLISALLLFAVLAGIAIAWPTPPPPPPPPVPQNVGINDTSVNQLATTATDQGACRVCHQTTGTIINIVNGSTYNNTLGGVPSRHHSLVQHQTINPLTKTPFGCPDCHPSTPGVGNGVLLDRSCLDCHNGTAFWADSSLGARVGNFSRPHHVNTTYDDANIGNPAAARQCKFCHGGLVNNYNDGHVIPDYSSSFLDNMVSPLATFEVTSNVPNSPSVAGNNSNAANKTWGGCYSCHLADPSTTPFAIEDNENNHHVSIMGFGTGFAALDTPIDLTGAPGGRICFMCHVVNTSSGSPLRINITNTWATPPELLVKAMELRNSTPSQNTVLEPGTTNVTFNGTGCEKCHAPSSLHNIQFNYVPGTNGPAGQGHVNNNLDCNGCHESWTAADAAPSLGAIVPTLNTVSPSALAAGTVTTLTITGSDFVNDVLNPDGSVAAHYTSVVKVDDQVYTPSSITSTKIVVDIPALNAGVHQLQLVKGESTSKLTTLTVVSAPSIATAKLGNGKDKGTVIITGVRFGAQPPSAQYVSVKHGGNQIVSTGIVSWTGTQIKVKNSAAAVGDVVIVLTTDNGETTATITR